MPNTERPSRRPRTTRRDLLRGLAGVAGVGWLAGVIGAGSLGTLAGCGLFDRTPTDQPLTEELDAFLAATVALAARYDVVLAAQPTLTPTLGALRDAHRGHASVLASALGVPVPPTPASQADAPADRGEAMAELSLGEKAGRDAAVETCLGSPPQLAALLGSIAAARASHLEILT